jgi:hypothetical protein
MSYLLWFCLFFHGNELVYPCTNDYKNITDSWRKITGSRNGVNNKVSMFDGNNWFRFKDTQGKKLSTSDPSSHSCGTNVVGWMNGVHPTKLGQIVLRRICFSWSTPCEWSIPSIKVSACRDMEGELFYPCQLKKPTACNFAYFAIWHTMQQLCKLKID